MTAWNSTSTNALNLFGCPADNWNAFNWGSFKWGSGTADLPVRVVHLVTNTLAPTSADQGFQVVKLVSNGITLTDDEAENLVKLIANTLDLTEDMAYEFLQDPNNWLHVFPEGVTNAHLQSVPTWTSPASGAVSWATAAAVTTNWS
jgi:hypothetical protein